MNLLVAFDGSDGGRDALELARVLVSGHDASALVVTVLYTGPLPMAYALLDEEEAEATEPIFEEAREKLPGIVVRTRAFGGGSPAGIITKLAEEEELDAIVVGSPHRGAVGRALIGSVAESLLHGAPCAVVLAPRGYASERHDPFRLIAVAYDGTPESKAALARAEAIALASNAELRLMTVVTPLVVAPGAIGYAPPQPADPEKLLNEAVHAVDPRLAAHGQRLDGSAATMLARACEDDVDLLVAGSRGYGPMTRVLLGSVSTKLVHRAPCPVLVVPRP
jgi:nucleotide-binding universal stress UspA family protein